MMAKTGYVSKEAFDVAYREARVDGFYEFFLPILQFHPSLSQGTCIHALQSLIEWNLWKHVQEIFPYAYPHLMDAEGDSFLIDALKALVKSGQADLLEFTLEYFKDKPNIDEICLNAFQEARDMKHYPCLFVFLDTIKTGFMSSEQIVTNSALEKIDPKVLKAIYERRKISVDDLENIAKSAELEGHPPWLIAVIRKRKQVLEKKEQGDGKDVSP